MRYIVLFIVGIFLFGISCFAQNDNRIRQIRDGIVKNDAATQHPKKGENVKTWMERGKLFYDAYSVNIGYLEFVRTVEEAKMYFREPLQIIRDEDGVREIFEYSQIKLIFENGLFKNWEEIVSVVDNPLDESVSAYQKARIFDVKNKNGKKIDDAIRLIIKDLESKFFNEFYTRKFPEAYNTALKRIEYSQIFDIVDTVFYFYAGLTAYGQSEIDSTMWQQSIDRFEDALGRGYVEIGESKGQIYSLLHNAYKNIGDSERAFTYAQKGFEKHPEYTQLLYDVINYYLLRDENKLALEYLEEAIARNPENPILLFHKGRVLDELGETEKALEAYYASIALDPTYFDPQFNLAVIYYNAGVRLHELADKQRIQADYDRYKALSDEEFFKSIAPMEKAYELRPEEIATVETLRTLYFRLRVKHPELEAKYEEMKKKLEEMQ